MSRCGSWPNFGARACTVSTANIALGTGPRCRHPRSPTASPQCHSQGLAAHIARRAHTASPCRRFRDAAGTWRLSAGTPGHRPCHLPAQGPRRRGPSRPVAPLSHRASPFRWASAAAGSSTKPAPYTILATGRDSCQRIAARRQAARRLSVGLETRSMHRPAGVVVHENAGSTWRLRAGHPRCSAVGFADSGRWSFVARMQDPWREKQ